MKLSNFSTILNVLPMFHVLTQRFDYLFPSYPKIGDAKCKCTLSTFKQKLSLKMLVYCGISFVLLQTSLYCGFRDAGYELLGIICVWGWMRRNSVRKIKNAVQSGSTTLSHYHNVQKKVCHSLAIRADIY